MKIPGKRRRGIAPVIGTLIFLLVAIVVFVIFGSVIGRGLIFNAAAINSATLINNKAKEFLVISSIAGTIIPANPPTTPKCPALDLSNPVKVRNTGSITSNITYTFAEDSSGNLWVCKVLASQTAVTPGGNETFYLPSFIRSDFLITGVITSLGNTFYTDTSQLTAGGVGVQSGPGLPVLIGGSLFFDPGAFFYFNAVPNPLGDGFVLNGFAPWPTTGGINLNLGSLATGNPNLDPPQRNWITFALKVKNLDPTRTITLNGASKVQYGGRTWFIVSGLQPEPAPYTSGVQFVPFNDVSRPKIGPGETVILYFATNGDGEQQSLRATGVENAAHMTVTLFGLYSDGAIFTGSTDTGVGYYTCLIENGGDCGDPDNPSPSVTVTCHTGTSCPIVASGGNFGPFKFDISGFESAPNVYWLRNDHTVVTVTDTTSSSLVSFSVPIGTPIGVYQIFISDGENFVDLPVQVKP